MALPLIAVVTTLNESHSAIVVDVSAKGAKLRGINLPEPGQDLFLSIDGFLLFGAVVRQDDDTRGIAFDEPLDANQEARLRQKVAQASGLPIEIRAAFDDWSAGFAR